LWTLGVDDLLKANKKGIEALYAKYSSAGKLNAMFMCLDDIYRILEQVQTADSRVFPPNTTSEQTVITAYSLSKMTLGDEMLEFENYHKVEKVEFFEFIGRWAYLLWKGESSPLEEKIENLLNYLLPLVGFQVMPVAADSEMDSESDYDDDFVQQVIQTALNCKIE
jgi:hypothetical protein